MLRTRWLGRMPFGEAHALQRGLFANSVQDYLLLVEHPHVFTLGARADAHHILVDPHSVGAEMVRTDRGGDVTYHGPGQLVGYPIMSVPFRKGVVASYVCNVEKVVIDALEDLGLTNAGRMDGYPGVWIDAHGARPRKICAVGVRMSRGRTMHGFALNVSNDLAWFDRIIPCGISQYAVTSLAAEGIDASMEHVVAAISQRAELAWGNGAGEIQKIAPRAHSGEANGHRTDHSPVSITDRKPDWLRRKVIMGDEYASLKSTMRNLDLVTVCEEAGCPNIYECWAAGTATFMINGDRCTHACGFCLVDTRKPLDLDPEEPDRVAEAVSRMGLAHAVVTAVARDDTPDGGAANFAATIEAIRKRCPETAVEVLIPDCKGDRSSLETIFSARPDILNHNLETVLRLQRRVRPSASYGRSLCVLAMAVQAGLTTKSGIMVGLGEDEDEVIGALADLRGVGVSIVTIGQYLRPSRSHLAVSRWWRPEEIDALGDAAREMGFAHVEASPLSRSSYHARDAAHAASVAIRTA